MGRFVRNIKTIIGTDYQNEFLEEQKQLAEKVVDSLPPQGQVNTSVIREVVRANDESVQELERSMEKALIKVKKTETKNRPIQLAEKATNFLESIDTHILLKMNDSELQRLARQLDRLEQTIAAIRENL
jgi:alcohol dehydrogenase class IV